MTKKVPKRFIYFFIRVVTFGSDKAYLRPQVYKI